MGQSVLRNPGLLIIDPYYKSKVVATHITGPSPIFSAFPEPKAEDKATRDGYISEMGNAVDLLKSPLEVMGNLSAVWAPALHCRSLTGPSHLLEFFSCVGRSLMSSRPDSIYITTTEEDEHAVRNFLHALPFVSACDDTMTQERTPWLFTLFVDVDKLQRATKWSSYPIIFCQTLSTAQVKSGNLHTHRYNSVALRWLHLKSHVTAIHFASTASQPMPEMGFIERNSPLLFSLLLFMMRQRPVEVLQYGYAPTTRRTPDYSLLIDGGPAGKGTYSQHTPLTNKKPALDAKRPDDSLIDLDAATQPIDAGRYTGRYEGYTKNRCLLYAVWFAMTGTPLTEDSIEAIERLIQNEELVLDWNGRRSWGGFRAGFQKGDYLSVSDIAFLAPIVRSVAALSLSVVYFDNGSGVDAYVPQEDLKKPWKLSIEQAYSGEERIVLHNGINHFYCVYNKEDSRDQGASDDEAAHDSLSEFVEY